MGTGDKAAGDLNTEATTWLKTYGGNLISDGNITSSDYNVSQKKFATDASYNATNFWNTSHDVDGTANNVQATGQDLKNVLEAFDLNHLRMEGIGCARENNT